MASVELQTALVAPVSDLAATVAVRANATDQGDEATAEVRAYSAGRRRIVRTPGRNVVVQVTAPVVTRATWLALRDLVGELVLFRDVRGRRVYGLMGGLAAGEALGVDRLESVSFTVTEVTYSEAV